MKNPLEAMKELTFGIEIELTGLSRRKAAKVVGETLNGSVSYYGGSYDQSAAELTEEYIKSLKIDSATASGGGGENIFFIILVIIIIAAAAFLIIRLAFSLTKDLRKVKKDGDEVKIHRRKY